MTYYCSECAVWLESNDAKMMYHNGRDVVHRYCKYDRKYRAYDQNVYNCSGFVYVRRAVLTKICEILNINPSEMFNAFDDVKENYVINCVPEKMINYNSVAPYIVNSLDNYPKKEELAKMMLNSYIVDAEANVKIKNYEKAVSIYNEMIKVLHIIFDVINDNTIYHKLVKIK